MNLLIHENQTALKGSVNSNNAVTGFKQETDGIDGLYERSNEGPVIVDGRYTIKAEDLDSEPREEGERGEERERERVQNVNFRVKEVTFRRDLSCFLRNLKLFNTGYRKLGFSDSDSVRFSAVYKNG
nr:hypothetical protein CFP56_67435 [Quercus suber]